MKMEFNGVEYYAAVWNPSVGRTSDIIAFDTETTVETDPSAVPEYVIGTVFDGDRIFFLRRQDLVDFWQVHRNCVVFMHSAAFDIEVTSQACGFDFHPMVSDGLIRDIGIYYRLLRCAKTGEVPFKYSLQLMCEEILNASLDKDGAVRMDFGRFYDDGAVDYPAIPSEYLTYAALDAVVTYKLAEHQESQCRTMHLRHTPLSENGTSGTNCTTARWGWLGQDIQLRGDIALRKIERNGMHVDLAAAESRSQAVRTDIKSARALLADYGYVPGQKGNQTEYDRIIKSIESQRGVQIASTAKTGRKSQAAIDLDVIRDHEFVEAFLSVKDLEKLENTYLRHLQSSAGRIHPRYNLLVRTGRTSCSSPNVQNLPRMGGIRECIAPAPGHVFLACDYSTLELCTLAQIAFSRYGHSTMRDLINDGVDLHLRVAAQILGKPEEAITKDERQRAKAVNFGLPGGMSAGGLSGYAREAYGVNLSVSEAEQWRLGWLTLFPEMQQYLVRGDDLVTLGETLDLDSYPNPYPAFTESIAAAIVIRVAGGAKETTAGRTYSRNEVDWAWQQIENSPAGLIKKLEEQIRSRRGSRELQRALMPRTPAIVPTGRVRAQCSFTEAKNGPFQGLAADGAKLALYDLIRAGHRVVAFVHDEVLVEVPEHQDYSDVADDISEIMINAMREVCPDVAIRTECTVMHRWQKNAKATFDRDGRLIAYEDRMRKEDEGSSHEVKQERAA